MKKIPLRDFILWPLLALIIIFLVTGTRSLDNGPQLENYSELHDLFVREQVRTVSVTGGTVRLELREPYDGAEYIVSCPVRSFELFYNDFNDLIVEQHEKGIIESYHYPPSAQNNGTLSVLLPTLILVGGVALLFFFMFLRQNAANGGAQGMTHFSKAQIRSGSDGRTVTFSDVAGADEEKEELQEIVGFLKDPERFLALGARIPKGVLLVGPPGTGKTLLARAVAGEAGVPFLSISGSDFVELYVGVGASRVRDLFQEAKKQSPAIVFIDEIDAVGRQRGTGLGGGHDEREQTLNQLLVEMDGFSANEGVIVLAATNRQDILDPALLRPGRFDRQVYVGAPDVKGRRDILKIHARNKPLAEDVDLDEIARATGGFTGADLENLMNESALLAARKNQKAITMPDIHDSILKVLAGPEKKSRTVIERERRLTAYHEAGHALVIRALSDTQDPVHQITIVPRGSAGGMTIHLPQEDRSFQSRQELLDDIAVCLGGRAAEELILGDISTGAGSDLRRASSVARSMILRFGMSEKLGSVVFDSGHDEVFLGRDMAQTRSYSEETAALIDEEVKRIIDEAYARCLDILRAHPQELEIVAQYLLRHETMDAEHFELVFTDPADLEKGEDADLSVPVPPAKPPVSGDAPGDDPSECS